MQTLLDAHNYTVEMLHTVVAFAEGMQSRYVEFIRQQRAVDGALNEKFVWDESFPEIPSLLSMWSEFLSRRLEDTDEASERLIGQLCDDASQCSLRKTYDQIPGAYAETAHHLVRQLPAVLLKVCSGMCGGSSEEFKESVSSVRAFLQTMENLRLDQRLVAEFRELSRNDPNKYGANTEAEEGDVDTAIGRGRKPAKPTQGEDLILKVIEAGQVRGPANIAREAGVLDENNEPDEVLVKKVQNRRRQQKKRNKL